MKINASKYLMPRIQDIFFVTLFIMVLLLGPTMLNLDGDFPRHLLTGKYILENKEVPTTELFIHPYQNRHSTSHSSEWLSDLSLYLTYKYTGLAGVVALCALIIAATFTLLYNHISLQHSLRLPTFLIAIWGAGATSLNWVTRPHLVSMLLLAVILIWADDLRRGKKVPLWRFPAIMLLWSNLHGEFIAGILVLIAYAVGWVIDYALNQEAPTPEYGTKIWSALALSLLASLLNPGGIGPWVGVLGFVNNQYLMSRMLEANSPNFQIPEMKVLLGLLAISVFLLAIKKEKLSAGQGLTLAGFSAMSLMATRNIHLFGVVAPFILADTFSGLRNLPLLNRLENTLQNIEGQLKGIFWPAVVTLCLSIFVITNGITQKLYAFSPSMFPIEAVEWLEENPQKGKMFNNLDWGGYLALQLWPEQLTFIDSMADVTGEVTLQYEIIITTSAGWEKIFFEQHNIEWIIVPPDSPLVNALRDEHQWKIEYEDQTAIILKK